MKVRRGPQVERARHGTLDEALAALDAAVAATPRAEAVQALGRSYEPVVARIELKGPHGARGGVDVRGDGSVVAWRGSLRRVELDVPLRDALQSVSVDP